MPTDTNNLQTHDAASPAKPYEKVDLSRLDDQSDAFLVFGESNSELYSSVIQYNNNSDIGGDVDERQPHTDDELDQALDALQELVGAERRARYYKIAEKFPSPDSNELQALMRRRAGDITRQQKHLQKLSEEQAKERRKRRAELERKRRARIAAPHLPEQSYSGSYDP